MPNVTLHFNVNQKLACHSPNIVVSFIGQVSCHLVMTRSGITLHPMQGLRHHALAHRAGTTFYTLTPLVCVSTGIRTELIRCNVQFPTGMATDTIEAFLRDLCDESITSKSELLTLAFLLGLKNPHQTVERLVRDHPRDIRQATWKFFCLWNNVDSSEHKLDKLKTAYSLMNKEGLYQRGTCIL